MRCEQRLLELVELLELLELLTARRVNGAKRYGRESEGREE